MIMKAGQQWHCTNPACRCEVLVQIASGVEGSNPQCVCGSPMKKKYTQPNFHYLDFLRIDEPVPAHKESHEA